jgi:ADP-ribose pyrophosphatase YjhB (NUDIX family)
MFKSFFSLALLAGASAQAAELTALEGRWLKAAAPVLVYSQTLKLPLDIIVQPQARASDVPLAMGYDGGRCKLVLSLRGNPQAEDVFAGVAEESQGELIEAMAAHEIAHCWRHAKGAWNALPAGFVEVGEETASDGPLLAIARALRESRREEAYADLAALAWTRHSHPDGYARVHGWLARVRAGQTPRGGHDTRAWVALARDGSRFGNADAPFEDAAPLWREGLLHD